MIEYFLIIIILALAAWCAVLQKKLNDEKVRREWDLAYFYYKTHAQDLDILTKDNFLKDFPVLKQAFKDLPVEEIKKYLAEGTGPKLPYFNK